MKKSIFILLVIFSIFISSCASQVTVTAEVTITLPAAMQSLEPSSTPTAVYTPTPAQEIIITPTGLRIDVIGLADAVTGAKEIRILPPTKYEGNEGAEVEYLSYFNAERLGFDPGTTVWQELADGRIVLVEADDSINIIAEYKMIDDINKPGVVWYFDKLKDVEQGNILFSVAKVFTMDGYFPQDMDVVRAYTESMRSEDVPKIVNAKDVMYTEGLGYVPAEQSIGAIYNEDHTKVIIYKLVSPYSINPLVSGWPDGVDRGFVTFRSEAEDRITIYVENLSFHKF